MRNAYLVSLLDDASRLMIHSAFCLGETALDVEGVLKQALLRRGVPKRLVVAPDPDYVWRVSGALDNRVPDYKRLTDLKGRKLILPGEKRLWPKRESLAWRTEQLNRV